MIDPQAVYEAGESTIEGNADWKQILMDAPGGAALRIAVAFYASKNLSGWTAKAKDRNADPEERKKAQAVIDEYREFREQLESKLDAFELKYLAESFGRMGLDVARDHYANDLLAKKTPEEQADGERKYNELVAQIQARRSANGGNDSFSWMGDGKPQEPAAENPSEEAVGTESGSEASENNEGHKDDQTGNGDTEKEQA